MKQDEGGSGESLIKSPTFQVIILVSSVAPIFFLINKIEPYCVESGVSAVSVALRIFACCSRWSLYGSTHCFSFDATYETSANEPGLQRAQGVVREKTM